MLCLIMLFGSVAVGTGGFSDMLEAVSIKASAAYSVGDTIYYGTYPQTDVTASLGSVLNSQSGTWKSYGYYSGIGSFDDGQMTASDYMRYKDVTYKGEKYRGVTFDSYRPNCTGYTSSASNTYQDDNGYTCGNVYWFKYEPLKWRVLDPSTGLVMCETIIDSQPYNNYILYADNEYWGDSAKTYYANNYAKSSIRQWLNNDFYNTAFSDEQKLNIKATTLNNDGSYTLTGTTGYEEFDAPSTSDKIFLLSLNEVLNSSYGFSTSYSTYDFARQAKGSDYAKCQGLWVFNSSGSSYDGCSYWRLRSPGSLSDTSCFVYDAGTVDTTGSAGCTHGGVCPALKLHNLKSDYAGSETEEPVQEAEGLKIVINNTNLGYYVGDKIFIAVSQIVNTGNKCEEQSIDKLSVKVSNSKVLSVSTMFKADKIPSAYPALEKVKNDFSKSTFIIIETKSIGYTYVAITNSETGETRNIPFLITEDDVATYRANELSSLDYIGNDDLYGTSVNNIYIDNFNYESYGSGYYFNMDVYNANHCPGVIEVYDANGKIISIKEIEKFENPSKGIYKAFKSGWMLISEAVDGSITTLKSEAISKKTTFDEELYVPKDGYIRITCDSMISPACMIVNMIDASFSMISFTGSAGKVIKGFSTFKNSDINKISAAVLSKLVAQKEYFKIAEEFQKKMSKNLTKSVINLEFVYNTAMNGYLLLEDMLETMGLTWDDIFKTAFGAGVSIAEDVVMDVTGVFGLILKIDFAVLETIDMVLQFSDIESASTGKSAHNIYAPVSYNTGILKSGNVSVNTRKNVDDDTMLETYHIIKGNKNSINLSNGKIYSEYEEYEIALVSKGKYTQPRENVEVSIICPYSKAIVARQNSDGKWEIIKSEIRNGMLVFEVDHFCKFAIIENNPTSSAKLNAKSSTTVDYRSKVNITATASGVPDGYFLAIYSGNTLLEKGTKDKVTYTPKDNNKPAELKSDTTYTVKVVDGKNAVQKDSNGKDLAANVEIKVKQGFFDKLIAFFKGLFGLLPTVEIKP